MDKNNWNQFQAHVSRRPVLQRMQPSLPVVKALPGKRCDSEETGKHASLDADLDDSDPRAGPDSWRPYTATQLGVPVVAPGRQRRLRSPFSAGLSAGAPALRLPCLQCCTYSYWQLVQYARAHFKSQWKGTRRCWATNAAQFSDSRRQSHIGSELSVHSASDLDPNIV